MSAAERPMSAEEPMRPRDPGRAARALAVLRSHPWTALLGATTLGFLLGRVARRNR